MINDMRDVSYWLLQEYRTLEAQKKAALQRLEVAYDEQLEIIRAQLPTMYFIIVGNHPPIGYTQGDILYVGSRDECIEFVESCHFLDFIHREEISIPDEKIQLKQPDNPSQRNYWAAIIDSTDPTKIMWGQCQAWLDERR